MRRPSLLDPCLRRTTRRCGSPPRWCVSSTSCSAADVRARDSLRPHDHSTGDHNLWVLRDGIPVLVRTDEALATDYVPVPETIGSTSDLRVLDVLPYLSGTKLSVFADESVLAYVASGGQADSRMSCGRVGSILMPSCSRFATVFAVGASRFISSSGSVSITPAAQWAGASAASSSAAVSLPHCRSRTMYFACLAITLRREIRSCGTSCWPTVIRCCASALKSPWRAWVSRTTSVRAATTR